MVFDLRLPPLLLVLLALCGAPTSSGAATPNKPSSGVPNDPDWHRALRQIKSQISRERWRGIRWLRQQTHPAATRLLIELLRHPHDLTRGWAAAALRQRKGTAADAAMKRALKDRAEMVRLNAVVYWRDKTPPRLKLIQPLRKDRSALVRLSVCKGFVPLAKQHQALLKRCLRDRQTLVRLGTAEALKPALTRLSPGLAKDTRLVLKFRARRPSWRSRRRHYNALWRLRRLRRLMRTYKRNLRYRIKRSNAFLNPRQSRCLKQHNQSMLGQISQFERWQRDYQLMLRNGRMTFANKALSRAFLVYRSIRYLYRKAINCRNKYPDYRPSRAYKSQLKNALIMPDAPPFLPNTPFLTLRLASHFTLDTAFDTLRNDIYPRLPPVTARFPGPPVTEAYVGGTLDVALHALLAKRWIISLRNQLQGHYMSQLTQLSGLNDHARLRILHAYKSRRRIVLWFFENDFLYTQNTFGTEGFPEQYDGPRIAQQARIGGTWRWGRFYRRWQGQGEWYFHLQYRNLLVMPLLEQDAAPVWSTHMNHKLLAHLERQLFFFRFGAKGELSFDHSFETSARVPTVQGALWVTFALGNIYDPLSLMRLEGGIGYGFLVPFQGEHLQPQPLKNQATEVIEPLIYVGVVGHFHNLPIQWWVKYWHQIGQPTRPPFGHYIDNKFDGQIRFGVPLEFEEALPRKMIFAFGVQVRVADYGFEEEKPQTPPDPSFPNIRSIRDIGFYLRASYPIIGGLRIAATNRLGFIRNEFVPYCCNAQDKTGVDVVRYVFHVQLEYLWTTSR